MCVHCRNDSDGLHSHQVSAWSRTFAEMGALCDRCTADKPAAATARCDHGNMDQNLQGLFPAACWIQQRIKSSPTSANEAYLRNWLLSDPSTICVWTNKENKLGNNRIILVGFSQRAFSHTFHSVCQWCLTFLVSYLPGCLFHAGLSVSSNSIKTLRLTPWIEAPCGVIFRLKTVMRGSSLMSRTHSLKENTAVWKSVPLSGVQQHDPL